ncbi:MAG TPA: hypothetical protein VH299_00770, partial [Solirubrobacterales bacterium]|nr:hypothetical protein [Solirubrobacterales bacterium]
MGIALLVSCVAALGIIQTADAKTVGKATATGGRQTKRAIVRKRGSSAQRRVAAKKKTNARGKATTSAPTPTVSTSPAPTTAPTDPATFTAPWSPVAGGGSEVGDVGTTTPSAPEIIPGPTPVETVPVTSPTESTPVTSPSDSIPAGRIFSGTKISDFALNQSAPGAITEVASPTGGGETALQMTVANSDVYPITPTDNPRAQLLSPNLFNPGDEFWWHSKFFLPA